MTASTSGSGTTQVSIWDWICSSGPPSLPSTPKLLCDPQQRVVKVERLQARDWRRVDGDRLGERARCADDLQREQGVVEQGVRSVALRSIRDQGLQADVDDEVSARRGGPGARVERARGERHLEHGAQVLPEAWRRIGVRSQRIERDRRRERRAGNHTEVG